MTTAHQHGEVPQILVQHRLRIAREFAGFEQTELADQMSVTRSTISKCENGSGVPRRSTIKLWAMACGVPAAWILTGEEPPPGPDGPNNGLRIISTLFDAA
jgi:transcriptional regulator with XRE-family HTH domain